MTKLAQHRRWNWPIRVGVATAALAFVVVLGRVLVMTPSAEAHADATFTLLYSFQGASDGANPYDGVVLDAAGNLYGTTKYGGYPCIPSVGCGTVFKLDTTGTKAVLYAFRGQPLDGNYPQARLLRDAAGIGRFIIARMIGVADAECFHFRAGAGYARRDHGGINSTT